MFSHSFTRYYPASSWCQIPGQAVGKKSGKWSGPQLCRAHSLPGETDFNPIKTQIYNYKWGWTPWGQRTGYFVSIGQGAWSSAGAQSRCLPAEMWKMWKQNVAPAQLERWAGEKTHKEEKRCLKMVLPRDEEETSMTGTQGAQNEVGKAGRGWWILSFNPHNRPGMQVLLLSKMEQFPTTSRLRAGTQTPTPKSRLSPCSVSSMFTGPLCWEWLGVAGWGWKTTQEALRVICFPSPCIIHKKLTVHWGKTFQLMGHPRYLVVPLTRCHWDLQALFQSWDESEFQRR